MIALDPLMQSIITELESDGLLATYMGGTTNAYAMEAGPRASYPYLIVEPVSMVDWSAGDFDGDDIQFQVSAEFARGEGATARGTLDVSKACARIRAILGNRDGFDLPSSAAAVESLRLDMLTGPIQTTPGTDLRMVMCRYTSGDIVSGPDGAHISGVTTFRAFIGPS